MLYYAIGVSAPSLHRESADSLIISTLQFKESVFILYTLLSEMYDMQKPDIIMH